MSLFEIYKSEQLLLYGLKGALLYALFHMVILLKKGSFHKLTGEVQS